MQWIFKSVTWHTRLGSHYWDVHSVFILSSAWCSRACRKHACPCLGAVPISMVRRTHMCTQLTRSMHAHRCCKDIHFVSIYLRIPQRSAFKTGLLPDAPAVHLLVQSSSSSRSCRLSTCLLILLHTPISKLHFRREAVQVTTRCKSSLPCRDLEC